MFVANFATADTTVDLAPAGGGVWRPVGGSHVQPVAPDGTRSLALRGLEVVILERG